MKGPRPPLSLSLLSWRLGAALVCAATAAWYLRSRLVFAPVPWPDGSAFYLPGLELVSWPPRWRMHAQAAFVPTYDDANFNLMPALPLVLGAAARLPALAALGAPFMIKAVSLVPLVAWAWLTWEWLSEALAPRLSPWRARAAAGAFALAGLWDPVIRWGTLVVRTETWVGLCWVWILRELWRWHVAHARPGTEEYHDRLWKRASWRISAGLAVSAYFHFEAVFFVPAVIVGLGFQGPWFLRLMDVAARTLALLSPWLAYVLSHLDLFAEQMKVQFNRLAHGNHWVSNPYLFFHSLFLDHGSPAGWPKFFNLAKGLFWALIAAVAWRTLRPPPAQTPAARHAPLAAGAAFAACLYLWITKAEVWFITLCHLALWPWAGSVILYGAADDRARARWARAITGLAAAYALISLPATLAQQRAISPGYTWDMYNAWAGCIEEAPGPSGSRPGLKVWQPHVPDALVELSRRRPGWDLTRTLDFPGRSELAIAAARGMDMILLTRAFNADAPRYAGPLRPADRERMSSGTELPFGPWALAALDGGEAGPWAARVCEVGPYWAVILLRK